ncbi:MAG: hypothetical protein WCN85_05600 [Burkholderiales bacterium]
MNIHAIVLSAFRLMLTVPHVVSRVTFDALMSDGVSAGIDCWMQACTARKSISNAIKAHAIRSKAFRSH